MKRRYTMRKDYCASLNDDREWNWGIYDSNENDAPPLAVFRWRSHASAYRSMLETHVVNPAKPKPKLKL